MKFETKMQKYIPMMKEWSKSKLEAIQYGVRLFSKPEVVLTQHKIDGFRLN